MDENQLWTFITDKEDVCRLYGVGGDSYPMTVGR